MHFNYRSGEGVSQGTINALKEHMGKREAVTGFDLPHGVSVVDVDSWMVRVMYRGRIRRILPLVAAKRHFCTKLGVYRIQDAYEGIIRELDDLSEVLELDVPSMKNSLQCAMNDAVGVYASKGTMMNLIDDMIRVMVERSTLKNGTVMVTRDFDVICSEEAKSVLDGILEQSNHHSGKNSPDWLMSHSVDLNAQGVVVVARQDRNAVTLYGPGEQWCYDPSFVVSMMRNGRNVQFEDAWKGMSDDDAEGYHAGYLYRSLLDLAEERYVLEHWMEAVDRGDMCGVEDLCELLDAMTIPYVAIK